jgi:hypothetical protein
MSLATGGAGRLSPMSNAIGIATGNSTGNRTGNRTGHWIGDTTGWMLGSRGRRLWTLGFLRMRA